MKVVLSICTYMDINMYFNRQIETVIKESLRYSPAVAILGPRQCGKSTLVKHILASNGNSLYLDLERPSDLRKLNDPEWFLETQRDKLVCLDEIQRKPELFPILRSLIDDDRRPGKYILLGSASQDLLRQSSESLAGRIRLLYLSPFVWAEINENRNLSDYLFRGGFPPSLLGDSDAISFNWRQDFITTFLEKDLLQFAGFTPTTMQRLWQMLTHNNGQTVNLSLLGGALGISHTTVRTYIDLLEGTFMLYQLRPLIVNTKKRLIKSPKVYLTDTGIATALLELPSFAAAAGHASFGALWETAVLENLRAHFPRLNYSFYRTQRGAEVDLVLSNIDKRMVIECKASKSPQLSKGNHEAIKHLVPEKVLVAAPVNEGYPIAKNITVENLEGLIRQVGSFFNL
ncbi:MAG: ATP-binding protein [Bacteroidota bacterium]